MMSEGGSLGYAAYIVCLPVFEIHKSNMGVTGSKGDLRGVKGSYLRHSDYDVIGRQLINQGGYLRKSPSL